MPVQQLRSTLCPNCRRLISSDEPVCPHCGLRKPGSRWRKISLGGGLLTGENPVRYVIYLSSFIFILSLVISRSASMFSPNPLALLAPSSGSMLLLGATGRIPIDQLDRWSSLLTATFVHGGILHILFNMLALRQIAPFIISEYGTYRTIIIFTLSSAGGFLLSYLAGTSLTLGASAAICGLIGAAIYYGKSRGGFFGHAVYQQVSGWAIGIFLFGFLVPGIDNWAHGGGLASGILGGFLLGYNERTPEGAMHKYLGVICVVAILAAVAQALFVTLVVMLE